MTWRSGIRGVLVVAMLGALAACTDDGDQADAPTSCVDSVRHASLPTWARDGFTPPDLAVNHVEGANGDIVGVMFGALRVPQRPRSNNKILWVSRVGSGGDPLRISACLLGTDVTAERQVHGGPGPSIIDLPRAGCWRLDLNWTDNSDQVYVPYQKGP